MISLRGARALASISVIFLVVSFGAALWIGAVELPPAHLWRTAAGAGGLAAFLDTPEGTILGLRFARALSCVFVGALLALAGSVLQRLLRNPLADPFVLGISSGGTVFVVAATVLGLPTVAFFGLPLRSAYALAGCFTALGCLLAARRHLHHARDSGLALMGLVLNAFFGAALMLFVAFADPVELSEAQRWMLGSLQLVSLNETGFLAVMALPAVAYLMHSRAGVDALLFGDEYAQALGFPAASLRVRALLACALLVSLVVSVSGSVGFVGLIVPHLARLASRRAPAGEWWLSMAAGAALLLWADTLSRTVAAPAELPVGVFTACLGAPVLALILLSRREGSA